MHCAQPASGGTRWASGIGSASPAYSRSNSSSSAARSGEELSYVPIAGAVRHGKRPPKLPRDRRRG